MFCDTTLRLVKHLCWSLVWCLSVQYILYSIYRIVSSYTLLVWQRILLRLYLVKSTKFIKIIVMISYCLARVCGSHDALVSCSNVRYLLCKFDLPPYIDGALILRLRIVTCDLMLFYYLIYKLMWEALAFK